MKKETICRNPKCGEIFWDKPRLLCPSCTLAGSWGMFIGGLIIGAIAWLVQR